MINFIHNDTISTEKKQSNHDGAKTAEENNISVINERTSDLRRKDKRVAAERLITEPGPLIDRN